MSITKKTSPTPVRQPTAPASDKTSSSEQLLQRHTPELVIGLVGPICAGVSKTGAVIEEILHEQYGYAVRTVKVSDIIKENAPLVGLTYSKKPDRGAEVNQLQEIGNKLRAQLGLSYLAERCVEDIALERVEKGYLDEAAEQPKALREVTIIDSIKHPDEVKLLRYVYGDMFWLSATLAPESVREKRLLESGVDEVQIRKLVRRDEDEELLDEGQDYGQKVTDTSYLADLFIRNDGDNDEGLKKSVERFFEILFNTKVHTPTVHEIGMHKAMSASSCSACMSKQVGAAIFDQKGHLLSVGANDAPKFDGGLYQDEDGPNDHRCYKFKKNECFNDKRKEQLYIDIGNELATEGVLKAGSSPSSIRKALRRTDIRNLIEYSRAIHAEMEAILSAARTGATGLVGSSLYTTTYPCHNCARHIVAVGVSEVYYIEPYAKSLALDLHDDAISTDQKDKGSKVTFLQFDGVAPRNILKLFRNEVERKKSGKAVNHSKKTAKPVVQQPLDGFTVYEKIVTTRLRTSDT